MARCVSTPPNTIATAYATYLIDSDEDTSDYYYENLTEDFQDYARELWPSLRPCSEWLGREDCAVLENTHAYLGISTYGSVIAYWIVPKNNTTALGWCTSITPRFKKTWGNLRRLGVASNGEAFYELTTNE